jgi:putative ABC transport system permease protein
MAIPFKVNFRSLFVRKTSTLTTIACLALVVAVFSTMMSLAAGLKHTFSKTGDPLNLMVMREGSQSETESFVSLDQTQILETLPGIAKGPDGKPVVTGEVVIIINKNKRGTHDGANITLRGVSQAGFSAHPEIKVVEGRNFETGQLEVIASKAMAKKFENCGLGETLTLNKRPFKIVGIFDSGGSTHDSELWGDVTVVREAFRRNGYSTVILRAQDSSAISSIKAAVDADQRLKLKVVPETQYFSEQTKQAQPIEFAGVFLATILAFGAAFGAANTMYAAVSSRSKEIGTLRAVGFSRIAILIAYVSEAMLLGLAGGILGVAITYLFVDGVKTGTANMVTFSEVSFAFRVTPVLVAVSIAFASVVGALGGLLPARLAARAPITQALRQL